MKLKTTLLGIMTLLLLWMAVSFMRPVPLESYDQYVADAPHQSDQTSAQTASLDVSEEELSASVD